MVFLFDAGRCTGSLSSNAGSPAVGTKRFTDGRDDSYGAQDDPVGDLPADIDGVDAGAGPQLKGGKGVSMISTIPGALYATALLPDIEWLLWVGDRTLTVTLVASDCL